MSIDEVIERLIHIKKHGADIPNESIDIQRKDIEALDMAIKALEEESKSEWQHDHEILRAYAEGADNVLEKLRAEIERMTPTYHNPDWSITDLASISDVLDIIDKYKAESEK